jgi:UDP:flavonoid glycosyltransferase YjiC (YdhE family)
VCVVSTGGSPTTAGSRPLGYVHRLYRQLAACDLAIAHGGLSTTMELTAAGRPFLYFPLRRHFEQDRHVAHRLDRHGAGRRMDYGTTGPESSPARSPTSSAARSHTARSRTAAQRAPPH